MDPTQPFDTNMQLLSRVLDLRARKAEVISANIANAETPGFSPSRFDFEQDLAQALDKKQGIQLARSAENHISSAAANFNEVRGKVIMVPEQTGTGDRNGVNVDQEMLDLSENELMYEASAQLLQKKLTLLKYVVSGGQ
jgi:flagellar basal-body rod protein FlgB